MRQLDYTGNKYTTGDKKVPFLARLVPSVYFYTKFLGIVLRAASLGKKGKYDDSEWATSSIDVLQELENTGLKISIDGFDNLKKVEGPCVIVGNHMSMMETMLLPVIVLPIKKVTFVVKESLLNYPVFKHVMRSSNPIAVTRTNPRQDLKTVMTEGVANLKAGRSVIVFPQTTRDHNFDPAQMSSIGIKLAKKAGVPVVPLALKTDAWTNGKRLKDFGTLDLSKLSCFSFGSSINIEGKGAEEQKIVSDYIASCIAGWREEESKLLS